MIKKLKSIFLFVLLTLCLFNSTNAQTIELRAGLNSNMYFDLQNGEAPYNTPSYSSEIGNYFGVSFKNLKVDSFYYEVSIAYENYGGTARARSGGLGGGRSVNAEINKSVISIGIIPFNQTLFKGLNLDAGFIFSFLIDETFNGSLTQAAGNIPTTTSLMEEYNKFNSTVTLGLQARLNYSIAINEKYVLSPFYTYYFGILNEFTNFPARTKSMRHQLGIGLTINL